MSREDVKFMLELVVGLVLGLVLVGGFNTIKLTGVGDLVGVFLVEGGSYSLLSRYVAWENL